MRVLRRPAAAWAHRRPSTNTCERFMYVPTRVLPPRAAAHGASERDAERRGGERRPGAARAREAQQ
eukprot:scaffold122344_cov27-Tisochrysis_lutea.AAC.1